MSIQNQLADSLGRKDQAPNKALAKTIVDASDSNRLDELVQFIETKPLDRLQMDAMLTIAYISEALPELVVEKVDFLIGKLNDPINRVIFASMIALSHMADLVSAKLYEALPKVIDAMDSGTVVTRDFGFRILVSLYRIEQYCDDVFYIISDQIILAPSNQLGQYMERMIPIVKPEHKKKLIAILEGRSEDLSNQYHLNRLNKNLKKLYR
jgi:hypothetical protein